MTNENGDQNQLTHFLVVDMNNANTSFLHNEEAGERRVQFFIGLLTAVIAVLGVIGVEVIKATTAPFQGWTVETLLYTKYFAGFSLVALMIVLAFGFLTFLRIVKRDCVTEEYKAISSYRRRQLGLDDPFDVIKKMNDAEGTAKRVKAGGLAQLLAFINSVIVFFVLALAILFLVLVFALPIWPKLVQLWPLVAVFSLLVAIAAGISQKRWSQNRREGYREALAREFEPQQ